MLERIDIVSDEISQDLQEVRAFLEQHRLSAIELRCVRGRRAPDLARADRETLKAWSKAADPRLLAVSPGLFKWPLADTKRTAHALREVLPASVDLAYELEAPYLIVFSFDRETGRPSSGAVPAAAVHALHTAAERCHEAGLELLIENEPGQYGCSAEELATLLETLAHPAAGANWDPLNGNQFERDQLKRGLERLFPYVRHVHVKNGHLAPGTLFATCGALTEGALDWPAHLARLAARGYQGWLGIETHHEPLLMNSARAVKELRAMLAGLGEA